LCPSSRNPSPAAAARVSTHVTSKRDCGSKWASAAIRSPVAIALSNSAGAASDSNCRSSAVAITALVKIGSSSRLGPQASINASVSVGP
jgi:hypothetical protein